MHSHLRENISSTYNHTGEPTTPHYKQCKTAYESKTFESVHLVIIASTQCLCNESLSFTCLPTVTIYLPLFVQSGFK